MALAPNAVVDGPERSPLPFGLFSSLTFRTEGGGRWQTGATYEVQSCEPVMGLPEYDCDPAGEGQPPKDLDAGPFFEKARPFTVYGRFSCAPVGYTPEEGATRAEADLLAKEERRVEQALWTGDLFLPDAETVYLNSAEVEAISSTPVAVEEGVARAEAWLADNLGGLGIMHMSRYLATRLVHAGLVEVKGTRLQTKLGTPVVAGSGYSSETDTIVTTGQMFGYRTSVFAPMDAATDTFDTRRNLLQYVAERTYLIGFDTCGHGQVPVTFT